MRDMPVKGPNAFKLSPESILDLAVELVRQNEKWGDAGIKHISWLTRPGTRQTCSLTVEFDSPVDANQVI